VQVLRCRTPVPLRFCVAQKNLGYGLTHPIALEGALKLREITYARCEGIYGGEFKHGPLSAVHEGSRSFSSPHRGTRW
jgi:hypothetical protein